MKLASFASTMALAATLGASSLAHANGRFPESNQIRFAAHDPDLVLLRVTFGLLVSHDRGKTFEWVCEQSIGFSGVEDPMYTVTPSNTYIATTYQGLTISRDQACGWSFAGRNVAGSVFVDLSANPKNAADVVVFSSGYDKQDDAGNVLFDSKVWETTDDGHTFEQLGAALDPGLLGYTIDLTSDPNRIYVTAVRNAGVSPKAVLLTSTNHGQSWEEMPILLEGSERAVFIAAVDPNQPERVYLRTSNTSANPTRLLVREANADGGSPTVRTLHHANGALLGFALSPDGSKIYIGGPNDGVKVANTSDYDFKQNSNIEVQCLAINADGLWACSNERNGFIAGLSQDDGATFEPRLRFCDIAGPLVCPPGTRTNDQCNPNWPTQKASLGCYGTTDSGANGPVDASPLSNASNTSKGCGCNTTPAGPWGALVAVVGAVCALVRLRSRPSRGDREHATKTSSRPLRRRRGDRGLE